MRDIFATDQADSLLGGSRFNKIYGGPNSDPSSDAADDTLRGLGNVDVIYGFGGDDRLFGGTGHDSLHGGDGDDVIHLKDDTDGGFAWGDAGADRIMGSAGVDFLYDGSLGGDGDAAARDVLLGGAGDDTVSSGGGADLLVGGDGNDRVRITLAASTADLTFVLGSGHAGRTVLGEGTRVVGFERVEFVAGSGDDRITGGLAIDTLVGGAGNDTLSGRAGYDLLYGGQGDDALSLGGDREGGVAIGDGGDDRLVGSRGRDSLLGGIGHDTLDGGARRDTLAGGAGADSLSGGGGEDLFRYYSPDEGGDVITDFVAGQDELAVSSAGFGNGLAPGVLSAARFEANTTGIASGPAGSGQFVYETDEGRLWWDADGAGASQAVLVATLTGAPALTTADITVF